MSVVMVRADGRKIEVPEERVAELWASGQFGFERGQRISAVAQGGEAFEFSTDVPEEIERVFDPANALRLETQEERELRAVRDEFGTATGKLQAFAGEAASTATLGLTDVAGRAIGGEEFARVRRGTQQANPGAAGLGTAAGIVAPLVVDAVATKGAATAQSLGGRAAVTTAKAATAPGRAVLGAGKAAERGMGRLLAKAGVESNTVRGAAKFGTSGAVEGALVGAGEELSEAALTPGEGNYDGLASKLAAGASAGAATGLLFGGALGGAAGSAQGAGKLALRALESPEQLARGALQFAAKRPGNVGKLGKLGVKAAGAAPDFFSRRNAVANVTKSNIIDQIGLTTGRKNALKNSSRATRLRRGLASEDIVGSGRSSVEMFQRADDVASASRARLDSFVESAERAGKRFDVGSALDDVDNLPPRVRDMRGQQVTAKQLDSLVEDLDTLARKTTDATRLAQLEKVRRRLLKQHGKGMGRGYAATADRMSVATEARHSLAPEILQLPAHVAMTAADIAGGAGLGAATLGFLGKSALKSATKKGVGELSRRSPTAARQIEDVVSPMREGAAPALVWMARQTAKVDQVVADAVREFLSTKHIIRRNVTDPVRRVAAKAADAADRPVRTARAYTRAETGQVNETLGRREAESRNDAFDRRYRDFMRSANPQEIQARLGNLATVAPQTAIAMARREARAADWLKVNAPVNSPSPNDTMVRRRLPPNPQDVYRWTRMLRQAGDPLSILEDVQDGTVATEQVETLKAVDPGLFEQIRQQFVAELSEMTEPPSLDQRTILGVHFDIHLDPTTTPEGLATAQAGHAVEPMAQPPAQGASQVSPPTHRATDLRTELQRLQSGEFQI